MKSVFYPIVVLCVCCGLNVHAAVVLDYRFDEASWSGVAGEVLDASLNAAHGRALGGASTSDDAVLCRAGDFRSSGTDHLVLGDSVMNGMRDFTISVWGKTNSNNFYQTILSGANPSVTNELLMLLDTSTLFYPGISIEFFNDAREIISAFFNDNRWHHFVWTRDTTLNRSCFYRDGVLQGCSFHPSFADRNPLNITSGGLVLAQDQDTVGGGFENTQAWDGLLDELIVFDQVLDTNAVRSIFENQRDGMNWDGSLRPCAVEVRGEYRFDATQWNGSADEVIDSSGNALHGTAIATDTVEGKVCRAADFSATGIADYIALDAGAANGLNDFAISFWIKSAYFGNTAVVSGAQQFQANEMLNWFSSSNVFRPFIRGGAREIGLTNIWTDTWRHFVWTRERSRNCAYVDGVLQGCTDLSQGQLRIDSGGLIIGQEQDNVGGAFVASQSLRGLLDELIFFGQALSAQQVQEIYANQDAGLNWDGEARECPSFGATGFVIVHDSAAMHCVAEEIRVRAVDASGDPVVGYSHNVTLDTGTGRGSWRLAAGSGVFLDATPDDGVATYTYDPLDQGEARFNLDYSGGPPVVDVDVVQTDDPNVTDDDTEGVIVFAASGFTVTATALPNPPPALINDPVQTQVAGTDFQVHLAAYGQNPTDASCGILESYQGAKTLQVWQTLINPASGTRTATIDLSAVGSSIAAPTAHTINFTGGQAVVSVRYKDAGELRLNFLDASSGFTDVVGATNSFVSRPADLRITQVQTNAGVNNPAATTMSDTTFVRAGESFSVMVEAIDAQGDLTPNFGVEAVPETLRLFSSALVLPVGGNNGLANNGVLMGGTAFVAQAAAGRFLNSTVAFDDVGVINLQAEVADGDYLGTGGLQGSATGNVGRFYVDEFVLESGSVAGSCSNFTYMDEPALEINFQLLATNTSGVAVSNYSTALLGANVAAVSLVAENDNDGVNRGGRLSSTSSSTSWVQGVFQVNDTAAIFARGANPDGGFGNLAIGVSLEDAVDGRELASLDMQADAGGNCIAAGSCSARQLGTTAAYYGRAIVLPAMGPENQDLPVIAGVEVFDNNGFVPFTLDNCTTYQASDFSLHTYSQNLSLGETAIIAPSIAQQLSMGRTRMDAPPLLSAPGFGNDGSVFVDFSVDAWLRFPWSGVSATNPTAQAQFGSYRGHDRIVSWSEDP